MAFIWRLCDLCLRIFHWMGQSNHFVKHDFTHINFVLVPVCYSSLIQVIDVISFISQSICLSIFHVIFLSIFLSILNFISHTPFIFLFHVISTGLIIIFISVFIVWIFTFIIFLWVFLFTSINVDVTFIFIVMIFLIAFLPFIVI